MKLSLRIGGLVLGVAAIGLGAVVAASIAWDRATARLMDRLRTELPDETDGPDTTAIDLPDPVARFLARSIPAGTRRIRLATIESAGEFRISEKDGWQPFSATQMFRVLAPAFVWDAHIRMAPLLSVRVRDAYLDGRGSMKASILGLVTVMDQAGQPELDAGALYRYLAEAVWFPTRLLPGRGVTWTAVDDSTAVATLSDGAVTARLQFRFDSTGDVIEVYTPSRPREMHGRYVEAGWIVRNRDHGEVDGFRIPFSAEVAWLTAEGEYPYWRGRLTSVRYDDSGGP